jgi:hypothetical protein
MIVSRVSILKPRIHAFPVTLRCERSEPRRATARLPQSLVPDHPSRLTRCARSRLRMTELERCARAAGIKQRTRNPDGLILRSIAQQCVSKDGPPQTGRAHPSRRRCAPSQDEGGAGASPVSRNARTLLTRFLSRIISLASRPREGRSAGRCETRAGAAPAGGARNPAPGTPWVAVRLHYGRLP